MPKQPDGCSFEPERLRTALGCVNDCYSIGYIYAGLQNGQECWCNNVLPQNYDPVTDCNMPCEGDATQ